MRMQSSLGFFLLICEHVFYFKIYFNPKQVREKKGSQIQFASILCFWQSVKVFSNRKPIPFSLDAREERKNKKKTYLKALYKKVKNKWFCRAQCSIDVCLSLYYYYFVQDDHYFRHKSNVNQFIVCFVACVLWNDFQAGFCFVNWAHKVSLSVCISFQFWGTAVFLLLCYQLLLSH